MPRCPYGIPNLPPPRTPSASQGPPVRRAASAGPAPRKRTAMGARPGGRVRLARRECSSTRAGTGRHNPVGRRHPTGRHCRVSRRGLTARRRPGSGYAADRRRPSNGRPEDRRRPTGCRLLDRLAVARPATGPPPLAAGRLQAGSGRQDGDLASRPPPPTGHRPGQAQAAGRAPVRPAGSATTAPMSSEGWPSGSGESSTAIDVPEPAERSRLRASLPRHADPPAGAGRASAQT